MSDIKWAFIFHSEGSDSRENRFVVNGDGVSAHLVAVPDNATAISVAKELVDQGIQFIELCGSFIKTPEIVDQLLDATSNKIAVGIVGFRGSSGDKVADLFKKQAASRAMGG
ncbi:DUF6506 family protein [Polyangium sorediatum]|uniref:DUF6506 family protein n=2 Tax=Polyangium sorediatum TaxID=889274 RepID=A0ABT6PAU2_9BACT|nr:DUF6506 family protein [Polyangium sorediatum]